MEENTQMRKEGDPIFFTEENEDSLESSPETNEAEETPVVEEDKQEDEIQSEGEEEVEEKEEKPEEKEKIVPLHKDERFREVIADNKAMREELEELKEFKTKAEPLIEREADVEVPTWFWGEQEQYKAYKTERDREINQAEERAYQRIEKSTSTESKLVREANQYLDNSISDIEEKNDTKIDKNKLLKTVMENELIDSKGRWNYKAGYKMMQLSEKPKDTKSLDAKKKLASSTSSDNKPESQPKNFKTAEDFVGVGRPW